MSQAYRETTEWVDAPQSINHTYLLEGDKMIAYIRSQTTVPYYFKKPITISRAGRRFELVEPNPFENVPQAVIEQTSEVREIEGSKGNKYYLNVDDKTCTCPGFTYRGTCKHVKELETNLVQTA
jgi:SWIM zinc finger